MDSSMVGGLSAVLGSLVGGTASIATAWFTQRSQGRRERAMGEIRKREVLYAEFIGECSKLSIDAIDKTLDNPAVLVQVYALQNRIRLTGSDAVIAASDVVIRRIIDQYFLPNTTLQALHERLILANSAPDDPIKPFSEACRAELRQLLDDA